ncbi:MAG: GTPase Era [Clostridia bacterium]
MFKSGFVSVIGRPNVGKSTLINAITKEKISIVTPKPQTTRKNIKAIYTDDSCQIVFLDTPGIHEPKTRLGEYMVNAAKSTFAETDVIVFITAPKKGDQIPDEDLHVLKLLADIKEVPKIFVLNKCDTIDQNTASRIMNMYSASMTFDEMIAISAQEGFNVEPLKTLITNHLEEGPMYYDEDQITDQTMREMAEDIIREKMLYLLSEEVPHGTAVEVENFKQRPDKKLYDIDAVIFCDKESHKGIVIGKGGSMLKRIGTEARKTMETSFDSQINLKLWVKIKNDWRNDNKMLNKLGYK